MPIIEPPHGCLRSNVELLCFTDGPEDAGPLVVIELAVPVAAKVPAPRQRVELAQLMVQRASVTSTVPAPLLVLRANNTALGATWCVTATLVA